MISSIELLKQGDLLGGESAGRPRLPNRQRLSVSSKLVRHKMARQIDGVSSDHVISHRLPLPRFAQTDTLRTTDKDLLNAA